jgi:membrane protein implicated in regulation of membrane protease activity
MPIGAQPPGRRGTVDEPYSPLNLRLILAAFGFVVCTVLAILLFHAGWTVPGWLLLAWALVAVVDMLVIQLRRRARRRAEGDQDHSLFE